MTKRELMREVRQHFPHLLPRQAEAVVNALFAALTEALARGERIELQDFGRFEVRHRQARGIPDPRTGARIAVPPKMVPFFKVAKTLRRRVQGPGGPVQGKQRKSDTEGSLARQN